MSDCKTIITQEIIRCIDNRIRALDTAYNRLQDENTRLRKALQEIAVPDKGYEAWRIRVAKKALENETDESS